MYWEGEGPLFVVSFQHNRAQLRRYAGPGAPAEVLVDQPFTTPGVAGNLSRIDEDEFNVGGVVFNIASGDITIADVGRWSHLPGTREAYRLSRAFPVIHIERLSLETGEKIRVGQHTVPGAGLYVYDSAQEEHVLGLPGNRIAYYAVYHQKDSDSVFSRPYPVRINGLFHTATLEIAPLTDVYFSADGYAGQYAIDPPRTFDLATNTAGPALAIPNAYSLTASSAVDGSAYTLWGNPVVAVDPAYPSKVFNDIPYIVYDSNLQGVTGVFRIEAEARPSPHPRGSGPAISAEATGIVVSPDGTEVFIVGGSPTMVIDVATGNRRRIGTEVLPNSPVVAAPLVPLSDAPRALALHLLDASRLTAEERP